nr:hypothetical protein [Roseofilum sp. Belize BBD 4]
MSQHLKPVEWVGSSLEDLKDFPQGVRQAVLEGVWEHKGYKDIAEEYHCSNDHVRKSASELWKLLSEMLGEEVKKKNVRSLIENRVFSYHNNVVQIGSNINICNDLYNNPKKNDRPLQPAKLLNRATTSVKHPNIRTSTTAPKNWLHSKNGYLQKIAASSR